MNKLFSDDNWMKRFDNHEIMLRNIGVQIVETNNYIFKLEQNIKQNNKDINSLIAQNIILQDIISKMVDKMVIKQ